MLNGRFASVMLFHDPALGRSVGGDTSFGGFSLESLITRRLAEHFGVKAGVTFDFNVETTNFQPVVLGTIRF